MNRTPDVELVLREWLADDGDIAPDRVLAVVADRIAVQPQRRARRLHGRPFMTTYAKLAAAAAAALIVGLVGWQLLPGSPGNGGNPTPAPTPVITPAPTPTSAAPTSPAAFVCEEGEGCTGLLTPGEHSTAQFAPAFAYVVPKDWMNPIDLPTIVGLTPVDQPADLILIWSGTVPADTSGTCDLRPKPGAGTSAADWVTYLTKHPGLDATNVQSYTVNGHPARSVDVRSFGGWTSPCAADRADYNVPLLKTPAGGPGDGYGVRIGTMARVYAIEVGTETVVVTVYSYQGSGVDLEARANQAEPVVLSLVFGGS